MKGNILLIAGLIPPYENSVHSTTRIVNFINGLVENNWNVITLSGKIIKRIPLNYPEIDNNVLQEYYYKIKTLKSYPKFLNIIISTINKLLSIFCDEYIVNVVFTTCKVIRLIKNNNLDIIIISCPPHSLSIMAIFIRYFYKKEKKIILDYRDSWTTRNLNKKFFPIQYILERLEAYILCNVDYLLVVSEGMKDVIIRKHNNALNGIYCCW